MPEAFDLYRTSSCGSEWLGSFLDFEEAKAKLTELATSTPGFYAIYDQTNPQAAFLRGCVRRPAKWGRVMFASVLILSTVTAV
jgi:hypothetical protein